MKKRKLAACAAALSIAVTSIPANAALEVFESTDGFTLGKYTAEEDQAAKAETESLYASRPKNERRFEDLSRGLVAVPAENGNLVSWRFLGTDGSDLSYNLYCNGEKLNDEPITRTNFFHDGAPNGAVYTLCEVENGAENGVKTEVKAWDKEYIGFKVTEREGYNIDDGAVADLDCDGEFEILLRRIPSMDVNTRTTYPLIEAYKMDGTHMWTINIGPNEINEHDLNIFAYDMNGDGKSEVIMRSFEGTTDGAGNTIGDENGDGITDYSKDPNNWDIMTDRQYLISTPEFLSMYDGETGAEIARTEMKPEQEPLSSWSYNYTDTGRLVKRASHFLFGLAYLDGVTPSFVLVRGAWDNVKAAAWHIEDNEFVLDWEHDTENVENVDSIYGACNHNMVTADIDFDGKDEIISGPMAIDHDGSEMYATKAEDKDGKEVKLAHGDAFDLAFMDPDYDGYRVWACHETKGIPASIDYHDARTGQVIWGYSKNKDVGRSRAADIDPTNRGWEVWSASGMIPASINDEQIADEWNKFDFYSTTGEKSTDYSLPMNFKVYWDGDLLSEFLDGTTVSKYNWEDKSIEALLEATECASNSGTKAVPCASADLFGDWREEIVWKTADEKEIRIYSTNIPTQYKITTLMHDSYYRACIANQSNHYNQPPNVGFYLGAETTEIPMFEGYVMRDGEKLTNPDLTADHDTYEIGNGTVGALSVKLLVDSPDAFMGTERVKIDKDNDAVTPIIENDRTLVPVRFISESLGMDVSYDDATREIKLEGRGYEVIMTADKAEYTVNGTEKTLDVPATVRNDRTLIPLRALAEAMGMYVEWDGDSRLVYVGAVPFHDKDSAAVYAKSLKTGKSVEEVFEANATPTPAPTEDPIKSAEFELYKDSDGNEWKMYVDEDFESMSEGDTAGWEGNMPLVTVTKNNGSNVIRFGETAKGNRNAAYTMPYELTGKAIVSFDWKTGEMTGGGSYGEVLLKDSSDVVILRLKTVQGTEMQYNVGNGTSDWTNVGTGFSDDAVYHVTVTIDFESMTFDLLVDNGTRQGTANGVKFENAANLNKIEVLANRIDKNWYWTTELDNIKAGIR